MSFSDAVSEMLLYLDGVVESLPTPIGNASKLPADVVVVRSLEKLNSGIGIVSEEDPVSNKIIEQGQFAANIDVLLWSKEIQNVKYKPAERRKPHVCLEKPCISFEQDFIKFYIVGL